MEAQQFAELQVAQLPADALRELVARYPFSASLQMLLLKQYQLNDHPAYDEQLAKAAVYAPDRRALYRLVQLRETIKPIALEGIESETTTPDIATAKEVLEATLETETEVDLATWHVDPLVYSEAAEHVTEEEPLFTKEEIVAIETETPDLDEAPEQEVTLNETTADAPTEEPQEQPSLNAPITFLPPIIPVEHFQGLLENEQKEEVEEAEGLVGEEMLPAPQLGNEQAVSEVEVAETWELEVETTATEELTNQPAQEEVLVQEEITEEAIVPIQEVNASVEDKIESNPQPVTSNMELVTDSFTGWLQRVKRHELPSTSHATMDAHDLQEKAALDALFGAGTYEATLVQESISLPEEVAPKVVATREELMEPDEVANRRMDEQAKKSLSMDDDLVTETLARIYEIQKKTGKAIDAYEVLKLRYPEKADIYNAKIQALRAI
jgi:hypothetical protein